jgi:hypothetical protein
MSDIKAGDLVMVVRGTPCCNQLGAVGSVYQVVAVGTATGYCSRCGTEHYGESVYKRSDFSQWRSCVIKIDPPALPESIERKKELTV